MNGGQVIPADEPTGALDSHSGEEVMAILKQLCARGHTVIPVTHDPAVARRRSGSSRSATARLSPIRVRHRRRMRRPSRWRWPPRRLRRQVGGRFREALVMARRAMAANKMRTALTMLGIIIGIASVVSIPVIGDAAKQMVLADIKSIGTNTVDIYPGKDFGDDDPTYRQSLKYGDLDALREQPYISALSPSISSSMRLRLGNVDAAANVNGVSEQFFRVYGMSFTGASASIRCRCSRRRRR